MYLAIGSERHFNFNSRLGIYFPNKYLSSSPTYPSTNKQVSVEYNNQCIHFASRVAMHLPVRSKKENHIITPVCRCSHHGALPLQAPGHFLQDALVSPGVSLHPFPQGALVGPDTSLRSTKLLQKPVHPQHGSLQQTALLTRGQQPQPPSPVRIFLPVWGHPAGPLSAARLLPAKRGNEDQDRPEKTLQRLLHRATQGTLVCVLQDKPQAQAEAGLSHQGE